MIECSQLSGKQRVSRKVIQKLLMLMVVLEFSKSILVRKIIIIIHYSFIKWVVYIICMQLWGLYVSMSNLFIIMSWRWSNPIVTDWKPAVQSVDPWSEWITVFCPDEGLTLEMSAFQLNPWMRFILLAKLYHKFERGPVFVCCCAYSFSTKWQLLAQMPRVCLLDNCDFLFNDNNYYPCKISAQLYWWRIFSLLSILLPWASVCKEGFLSSPLAIWKVPYFLHLYR